VAFLEELFFYSGGTAEDFHLSSLLIGLQYNGLQPTPVFNYSIFKLSPFKPVLFLSFF
jgi:hypothetical protein